MKRLFFPFSILCNIALFSFFLVTCNKSSSAEAKGHGLPGDRLVSSVPFAGGAIALQSSGVSLDTANRMIRSYLDGIDYKVNTNETRAWFFDADALRAYLADTSIDRFKIVLAHSMAYITGGHEGQRPAPNDNALALIVVGVNADNNYVLTSLEGAIDHGIPCPTECLSTGSASNELIKQ